MKYRYAVKVMTIESHPIGPNDLIREPIREYWVIVVTAHNYAEAGEEAVRRQSKDSNIPMEQIRVLETVAL